MSSKLNLSNASLGLGKLLILASIGLAIAAWVVGPSDKDSAGTNIGKKLNDRTNLNNLAVVLGLAGVFYGVASTTLSNGLAGAMLPRQLSARLPQF